MTVNATSPLSRPAPLNRPAGMDSSAEILAAESQDARRCLRVAMVSSLVGAGIGLLALLGYLLAKILNWGQGWIVLAGGLSKDIPPHPEDADFRISSYELYHHMVPSTATALLILTSALFVHIQYRNVRLSRIYGMAGAFVVAVWVLAILVADLVWNPVGKGEADLRMSPITAASFLIVALGLFLLVWDRTSRLVDFVGALMSIVALVNLVIVLSYLDLHPLFYQSYGDKHGWQASSKVLINPVALTTATGFLCVTLGLIYSTGRSHFPLRVLGGTSARALILRSLPLASLVAAACFSILFRGIEQF